MEGKWTIAEYGFRVDHVFPNKMLLEFTWPALVVHSLTLSAHETERVKEVIRLLPWRSWCYHTRTHLGRRWKLVTAD